MESLLTRSCTVVLLVSIFLIFIIEGNVNDKLLVNMCSAYEHNYLYVKASQL